MSQSTTNNSINIDKTPFMSIISDITDLIPLISIKYQARMSDIIDFKLKERENLEKSANRVTSIIKYDFFPELYRKNNDKTYLKTYLHDRLLDVSTQFFDNQGFKTYKERFLRDNIDNKPIKGHADLILNDNTVVDVKNYTEGTINYDDFLQFIHQIMIYSRMLSINYAVLIIHNPKQYKKVCCFRINLTGTEEYLDNYLKEILLIQDYKDNFKYTKSIK